jgi:chromosome segregation ATPase
LSSTADSSRIEASAQRLKSALAALETAVARRIEGDRSHAALSLQLEAVQSDRAKLAEDLDLAAERIAALEEANRDVAERLDQTMDAIRSVLSAQRA